MVALRNWFCFCHKNLLVDMFCAMAVTHILVRRHTAPQGREPWRPFDSGRNDIKLRKNGSRLIWAAVFSIE